MGHTEPGSTPMQIGILTDLDTLLDTRFGTIARYAAENQTEHLATLIRRIDRYRYRLADSFIPEICELPTFETLYAKRDKLTLAYSVVTPMVDILRTLICDLRMKIGAIPYTYEATLYVNTHPYVLTDFEREELRWVLREAFGQQAIETVFIHLPLSQLSVYDIRAKFHYLYLYHYYHVLDSISQKEEIKKVQMPDRAFVAPALIIGDVKTVIQQHGDKLPMLYEMLSKITEPFLKLEFIDPVYYCACVDPPTDDNRAPRETAAT